MTKSHEARIEAGADALRQLEQGGKRLNEWSSLPNATKKKWREKAALVITAYLAGDAVVPREATQAMIDAGQQAIPAGHGQAWLYAPHAYRAMVSAATEMEQKG